MLTIVLTGGGSGGHITPLLSLAHALKAKDPKCHIVYIGLKGEQLEGLQGRYSVFDQVCFVASGKFRRYHGKSLLAHLVDIKTLSLNGRDLSRVIWGLASARRQLKRIKPDIVFSKGGYVAVPVGLAAHQLGIPIITHDSDAVPGLANRIVGRWAAARAVGQPLDSYQNPAKNTHFTGIPIDERIKPVTAALQAQYRRDLGLPADALIMLIAGGGLGSGRLNDLMAQITPKLLEQIANLFIVLISGQQHQASTEQGYGSHDRVKVIGFTDEFYRYSGAADLIVARAGATTLAEFALQAKACVIIPAAQLTGGHQLANVKRLRELKAAKVLDADPQPQQLLNVLAELLQNKAAREELAHNLSKTATPNAATSLADLILGVAANKAVN